MTRLPPPVVALGAAMAQRGLSRATPRPSKGRAAVAASLALASLSMAATAARGFRRSGTTLEPLHPDQASVLVTSGPYTVSRNPMYVGLAGLLAAHAAWRGSWAALLPLAGFVAIIDRSQIQAEEAALLEKFGPEYSAYRATSPRWIDRRSFDLT